MSSVSEQFEQSFGNLAYSALNEKDSSLQQYVVGFQLIDHNEEGTKALGFFALRLGDSYYYVPVFFLGGKLKPLELMYSREEDKFVPLTAQWLEFLGKDSMREFGESVAKPKFQLSNPDLTQFREPPSTGRLATASDSNPGKLDWYDLRNITRDPIKSIHSNLDLIIKRASLEVKTALKDLLVSNPKLVKAASKYVNWEDVINAFKTVKVADLEKKAAARILNKSNKVEFLEKSALADPEKEALLRDSEKKALSEFGMVAIDNRTRTSDVYKTYKPKKLEAVNNGQIYRIIDGSGDIRTIYGATAVLKFDPTPPSKARLLVGPGKRNVLEDPAEVFVIDLKSGSSYRVDNNGLVGELHPDNAALKDKMYKAGVVAAEVEKDRYYTLMYRKGEHLIISEPFKTHNVYKDAAGNLNITFSAAAGVAYGSEPKITVVNRDGQSVTRFNQEIVITRDVRFFPITHDNTICGRATGNKGHLTARLMESGLMPLNITSDGVEATIESAHAKIGNLDKKACAENLAKYAGIEGNLAIALTNEAFSKSKVECLVKVAYPIVPKLIPQEYAQLPYAEDPDMYYNDLLDAQMQDAEYEEQPQMRVDGYSDKDSAQVGDNLGRNLEDPQAMPYVGQYPGSAMSLGMGGVPPTPVEQDRALAMQAAELGVPEVFDAGILSTMANLNEAHDLVMSFIPELERALDRLGRMIYLFWWKYDEFADQYGVNDLYDTEDKLKNLFKALGDIILKFKRKGTVASSLERVE